MAIFSSIAAAVGSFFASLTWGAVGTFLLKSVASLGLSALAQKLSGKDGADRLGIKGQLDRGADVPQAFIVGRYATAGSLTYANTSQFGATAPNGWMTWVITLSDLPCAGVTGLWVNGAAVTLVDGVDGWVSASEFIKPQSPAGALDKNRLQFKFYNGTQTAADPWLTDHVSSLERPWDATAVGYGKSYVIVRAHIDADLYRNGFPTFLFEVQGIPLYDISKDSSVGGSGAQRWHDASTWQPSENVAVQLYNVLRGIRYNGEWFYGLQGVAEAQLPAAHWIAQVAKCASGIEGASGSEALFRASGEIPVNAEIHTAIQGLLTACNGRLSDAGGVYKLFAGAPDAPVATLTDDDILSSSDQSFTPFLGLAETVNGVSAKYPSPAAGWQVETAPPLYRADYEAEDGGRRLLVDVSLDFVPYAEQAQRLMQAALNEARRARRHTFHLPPKFWPLEPGDVIAWTSVRNGYQDKQFRVDGVIDLPDADVIVDLTEVDPADYVFDTAVDFTPPAVPGLLPQPIPVQEVEGFLVNPASLADETGAGRRPAIQAVWNGDIGDVRSITFELRVKATGVALDPARSDTVSDGQVYISNGILPAVEYEVRAKFIPDSPRPTDWSIWKNVTAPDLRPGFVDLDQEVGDAIDAAQMAADQLATDVAEVDQYAQDIRNDHNALVNGFVGGDLASAFAGVDADIEGLETSLSAEITLGQINTLPSTFEQDSTYWTHALSGAPSTKGTVSTNLGFRTVAGIGRVLFGANDGGANRHVAPKGYLPYVTGNTYRIRLTARHVGAPGAGTHILAQFRKMNESYGYVSAAGTVWLQFAAADVWEVFEVEYTASGADAAYMLPFMYFPATYNNPGTEIEFKVLEISDITDAANVSGEVASLSATLTNNYMTAVDTNSAITQARTDLGVDISALQGNITDITALSGDTLTGTIFGVLLSQLGVTAGGVPATVTAQGTAIADLEGNASAGYLIRAQAGSEVSLLDLIAADGSAGSVSIARIAATNIILDGTVSLSHMSVGSNANLLENTDLSDGTAYFSFQGWGAAGAETTMSLREPSNSFTDGIRPTLQMHQTGVAASGYSDVYLRHLLETGAYDYIEVEPNTFYEFSAYIAAHRCTGQFYLQWRDANKASISAPSAVVPTYIGSSTDPNSWQRPFLIAKAPANARYVNIIIRKFGTLSGADSFMFIHHPMFAVTHANATQPSQYLPRGISYFDGKRLVTNTVSADKMDVLELSAISANIGHFKSAASGERIEIQDDVIEVYDAAGVVRVKLGNLG